LFHEVTVAFVVPKRTAPVPCVTPKKLPEIVTLLPTGPLVGLTLMMTGKLSTTVTLNVAALLDTPFTVTLTATGPAVVFGTLKLICEALHDSAATGPAPKRTMLVPCVVPKLLPKMVTRLPGMPVPGATLVIDGTLPGC
jgi:hypothetical protein